MRTKEEFKKRFRFPLIGMAAYGCWVEERGTQTQKAEARVDMPANVELLLESIYEYLAAEPDKPQTAKGLK